MSLRSTSWWCVVVATCVGAALFSSASCNSPKPKPKSAEEAADEKWAPDGGTKEETNAPKEEEPEEEPGEHVPELKLRDSRLIEASVDYTGAVLIIGKKARLIVPEEAISMGTVMHFGMAGNNRQGPARIGKVYEFAPKVSSAGPAFRLELPLPRGRKSANFAMSRVEEKGGSEKLVWDVRAATRIEEERGVAVLELSELSEGWIHLTSKKPD